MVKFKKSLGFGRKTSSKITPIKNDLQEEVQEEYVEILSNAYKLLRVNMLWPQKGQTRKSLAYKLQVMLALISYSITGTTDMAYIAHTFWTGSNYLFADILENIAILCTALGIYLIMINLLKQAHLFEKLMKDIGSFGEFGKPPNFDKTNANMNKFLFILYLYGHVGVALYVMFALLDRDNCEATNIKYDMHRMCGFMSSMWVPFTMEPMINKIIFFVLQATTCGLECSAATMIIAWFLAIVEVFLTRVSHLKEMLLEINLMPNGSMKRAHLNKCVRYHLLIISMADQINECIGKLVFVCSGLITICLGLCSTLFLVQLELYTLTHGMGWVLLMFILCQTGQRLMDESSDIPIGVYDFDWFESDLGLQKDVIFFIMRSNEPLQLRAAGFFVVSMSTFTTVMKNAYSFLALIRQSIEGNV